VGVGVGESEGVTLGRDEEVDGFDYVEEELVLAVLDAGLSPRTGPGARDLHRDLSDLVVVGRLVCKRARVASSARKRMDDNSERERKRARKRARTATAPSLFLFLACVM
jgi:hypothetical protein